MNWFKSVGYGCVLFALMFVLGSIVMFGLKLSGLGMSLVMLILGILVLWLLAKQYKIVSLNEGLQVGLVWLIVDVLLEYYVIVQTFNAGKTDFYTWSVLLGYVTVVAVPALVGVKGKN